MIELEQLKLLTTLASADGNLGEDEKQFILNIGRAHGYSEATVEPLFSKQHKEIIMEGLTLDQRIEYVLTLTQLMLIDKKMYLKELEFCSEMVEKLGFEKLFIYRLIDLVGNQVNDVKIFKEEALKFLKSK
jgi:hypothetical protein